MKLYLLRIFDQCKKGILGGVSLRLQPWGPPFSPPPVPTCVSVWNKCNRRTEPKPHKASSFICILSIVYSFLQLMNTKQLFHCVPNFFNGPISHSFFAEASTSLTVFWAPLLPRQLQQSNSFKTFIWASFSGKQQHKDPKQPGGRQLGHFHIQEKE